VGVELVKSVATSKRGQSTGGIVLLIREGKEGKMWFVGRGDDESDG